MYLQRVFILSRIVLKGSKVDGMQKASSSVSKADTAKGDRHSRDSESHKENICKKICLESEKLPVLSARQTEESDCPLGHAHLGTQERGPVPWSPRVNPLLDKPSWLNCQEWGGENNAII